MTEKTHIVEELGETSLVLPNLVAAALRANDRAKYYMSVLQASRDHADHPDHAAVDLRAEREASGEDDATLDDVVRESRAGLDGAMVVPQAQIIHEHLLHSVEQMLAPLRIAGELAAPLDAYVARLATERANLPAVVGDNVPAGYVEAITSTARGESDSLHLLVMDLHKELNQVQRNLAEESLDGASVYGLSEDDRPLVREFMRGVNATSPLKFDHPGLGTTATRSGGRLIIQNDLGTTDAHVLVVHVEQFVLSFVYTDVHRARLLFFKGLFDGTGITWSGRDANGDGAAYHTCIGRRSCASPDELGEQLAGLGSKLVFLIDWNRARKRLARFVRKADAVAILRWAADNRYGHRAFLECGGERLVYNALVRTAPPHLRYGARLDEVLGPESARSFLQAVVRITSEGLCEHRSLRLVRDEVQAELVRHLHDSQQGMLAFAADHAALIVSLALVLEDAIVHLRTGQPRLSSLAERAKRWETKADEIVTRARQAQRHMPDAERVAGLLPVADDVADGLEEAIFLVTLVPEHQPGPAAVETLQHLARLTVLSALEYVKCIELANEVRRSGTRDDVQDLLVAVDRVITLEHESDDAERYAEAAMLTAADNFRVLHLLSEIAKGLEASVDVLARCALMLKDAVMSEMLVE